MLNWPCSNVPLLISFCEKWRAKVRNIPKQTRIYSHYPAANSCNLFYDCNALNNKTYCYFSCFQFTYFF